MCEIWRNLASLFLSSLKKVFVFQLSNVMMRWRLIWVPPGPPLPARMGCRSRLEVVLVVLVVHVPMAPHLRELLLGVCLETAKGVSLLGTAAGTLRCNNPRDFHLQAAVSALRVPRLPSRLYSLFQLFFWLHIFSCCLLTSRVLDDRLRRRGRRRRLKTTQKSAHNAIQPRTSQAGFCWDPPIRRFTFSNFFFFFSSSTTNFQFPFPAFPNHSPRCSVLFCVVVTGVWAFFA
ncbi:hypothetical protein QBC38DRAFT_128096 [Podospora fimiseda]|uniref:Uncharacterized protein n=1 Tax=Podospora fimiseda TaxID=252190 RepID=A0AAN7BT39_9PEZI|nr:hypothetical protein QBC38DRAFT_128096 [Podospora fimiseda]